MPRKPAVPHVELRSILLTAKEELTFEGLILGPTAEVWKKLALKLDYKLSPKYIYQYIKENRHEIQAVVGIKQIEKNISINADTTCSSVSTTYTNTDEQIDVQPEKTFSVLFTPQEWDKIKPIAHLYKRRDRPGFRRREVLPQNKWGDMLVEKLWQSHKLPCPYTMTRGQVSCGEDSEYIKIFARCKECGASATGVILCKPIEGEGVSLSWRSNDTRSVPHHKTRWLSGPNRRAVGTSLQRNCASAYRKELAFLTMDQGDLRPPRLWSSDVLRKAKQERREEDLGIKGEQNPILNLLQLKYSARYVGAIHDIGLDKFFVHYHTAAQMLLYKKHCRASYTKLSVDATGTLVKKIKHSSEKISGHIFLYEGVMSATTKTSQQTLHLPVCQMLSEKHDANSITYWLNEWRRSGAPVPNEIVVDNSAALKSAVARVFAGTDLKTYLNQCFAYANGRSALPKVYIRLDVAHYICAASRWAIWTDKNKKRIKEFYLRCLGILIDAQTLKNYESAFRDILVVALSPCERDSLGNALPMEESLSRLAKSMTNDNAANMNVPPEENPKDSQLPDLPEDIDSDSIISVWIRSIKESVNVVDDPVGRPNPYFLPDAATEFCRMASEFVLWSNVLTNDFVSPFKRGTSSPVESEFADLKCHVLKGETKPLKIDTFMAIHLKAIDGACRIGHNNNMDSPKRVDFPQENSKDSTVEDLNEIENWRGLGVKCHKRSKYLTSFPGAEDAIKENNFKCKKYSSILKNGTGKAVTGADGTAMIIKNTCTFDSICHLVANAYQFFACYRNQMTASTNSFIMTVKSLTQQGASAATYALRAETLASVLEPRYELNMPLTRRHTLALEYDAYGNVGTLLTKMVPPHMSLEVMCEVVSHQASKGLVDPDSKILIELGIDGLNESLQDTWRRCNLCTSTYGDHLFVDVEFLSNAQFPGNHSARLYKLREIPKKIFLGKNTFHLSGVIHYAAHHYVAYCMTPAHQWRKVDDLCPRETHEEDDTEIWPTIIMYINMKD